MTKQTSFWQAAAKTSEIRELDEVKATLRMLHGITKKSNKDLELDSLLKNCFDPADLIENAMLRSAILSELDDSQFTENEMIEIDSLHREIGSKEPDNLQTTKMLRLLGVQKPDTYTLIAAEPDEPIQTEYTKYAKGNYQLFPHQLDIRNKALEALQEGNRTTLIHMPTGAGKTRTAMTIVTKWLNDRNGSVLWASYGIELIAQSKREFLKAWQNLGLYEAKVCDYESPSKYHPDTHDICFGSLSKLGIDAKKGGLREIESAPSLVIIDEAHQALAPTYREAIDYLTINSQKNSLLGLTATPGRTSLGESTSDIELSTMFNKNKIELQTNGYASPINYLIEEGYMSKPEYECIEIDTQSISESEAALAKCIDAIDEGHKRIILFAKTIDDARKMNGILKYLNIKSYFVEASTPQAERKNAYRDYESNFPRAIVLVNYAILATGFDAPKTSCVIIGRSVESLVLYNQIVGRALRGEKSGGTRNAKIITINAKRDEAYTNLVKTFTQWNHQWSNQ